MELPIFHKPARGVGGMESVQMAGQEGGEGFERESKKEWGMKRSKG